MSFIRNWFDKRRKSIALPSRQFLEEVLDTLREAAIIVSEDTRIVASNNEAYAAFGKNNGRLENKRLSEVIRDLSVHEAFQKALESGEPSEIRFEFTFTEKRTFSVRVARVDQENTKSVIGIFYDLTQIERLEKVRQEFLSNVSHELRTPLTSIIAFVETLEDGAIDDQTSNRRFLGVIRKNAERMHKLIDEILELSSIEARKIILDRDELKLSQLIEEVFTNISGKAAEKSLRLQNNVDSEMTILADKRRFEQILTNLIDNAVKFNRDNGFIDVDCQIRADSTFITIADSGEGISIDHLPRVFERFYRADRARTHGIGGTGLGLAIVKHLVRSHGGEVSVESTLGKGSVFTIELPAKIQN